MTHASSYRSVLVALLVVGVALPATAAALGGGPGQASAGTPVQWTQANETGNHSGVNASVGQQLSTVLRVTSDEVRTDFENVAFEVRLRGAGERERAEEMADRAGELRDRAEAIREDYETATEAFESGEINASEYARRLATLNARARNVRESHRALRNRTRNVSDLELRAAGLNRSALDAALADLGRVSGAGPAALLEQFVGASRGEVEIETADGLRIAVESEDGERSREVDRPRDDNRRFAMNQSAALETARRALSTPERGNWTLVDAKVKQYTGAYEFEFALRGGDLTGEAEVRVDGSSGRVYRLEEEVEAGENDPAPDESDDDREDDDRGDLAVVVVEGTPAPGATVTLAVTAGGDPVANATVRANDRVVGTTGPNGTVTAALPAGDSAELTARKGDAEGELEFEFREDDGGVYRKLSVDATLEGGTVSVAVTYDGAGVANATVFANGESVGATDSGGSVAFDVDANDTEDLELAVVKGDFEAEVEYELRDGALVVTDSPDGDESDDGSEDDSEDGSDDGGEEETDDGDADEGDDEDEDEESEDERETETVDGG